MFPHQCGAQLAELARNGADPKRIVPNDFLVVRGGTKVLPPPGITFSATIGPTLDAAAAAVPHGQIRVASVGAIRQNGGVVEWAAETSPHGTINQQHVNVTEFGGESFSEPRPNPVPRKLRIDAGT